MRKFVCIIATVTSHSDKVEQSHMGSYFSCCSLARAAAAPASHFATHLDLNSIDSIGA